MPNLSDMLEEGSKPADSGHAPLLAAISEIQDQIDDIMERVIDLEAKSTIIKIQENEDVQ